MNQSLSVHISTSISVSGEAVRPTLEPNLIKPHFSSATPPDLLGVGHYTSCDVSCDLRNSISHLPVSTTVVVLSLSSTIWDATPRGILPGWYL